MVSLLVAQYSFFPATKKKKKKSWVHGTPECRVGGKHAPVAGPIMRVRGKRAPQRKNVRAVKIDTENCFSSG